MRATLIEIDVCCPPGYWYHEHRGTRLWACLGTKLHPNDSWVVLPGQGISTKDFDPVVFFEHAWQVREGVIELELTEVGEDRQQSLGLAGEAS